MTVTEGARILGVTRQALNTVVNEKAGISPEMAVRLAKAFGRTADAWLRMQVYYDLAQVRESEIHVRRLLAFFAAALMAQQAITTYQPGKLGEKWAEKRCRRRSGHVALR